MYEVLLQPQVSGHVKTYHAKDPMKVCFLRPSPRKLLTRGPQTGPHVHLTISLYAGKHHSFIPRMSPRRQTAHEICSSRQQETIQSAGVTQVSGTSSAAGASAEEATTERPPLLHRSRCSRSTRACRPLLNRMLQTAATANLGTRPWRGGEGIFQISHPRWSWASNAASCPFFVRQTSSLIA